MTLRPVRSAVLMALALVSTGALRADQKIDSKAKELLQKAREISQSWKTLQAQQDLAYEFGGQKMALTGLTKAQMPGKIRTEMGGTMEMIAVSDGKKYFIYMKRENTYMTMPAGISLTSGGNAPDAAAVSFGDLETAKYDTVTYAGKEKIDGMECDVIKATKDADNYTIYLQADLRVRRTILDSKAAGNVSRMQNDYRNYVVDAPLDPSIFKFQPPKGATEMKMPTAADYEAKMIPVGKAAPTFTIPNPKGGQVSLADLCKKNKAVIVNFWFYG